jgi:spermidine synthase
LRDKFALVTPYFAHIPTYGATWGFAVASQTLDVRAVDANTLEHRLAERQVGHRQYYNGATHHAALALPEYVRTLVA